MPSGPTRSRFAVGAIVLLFACAHRDPFEVALREVAPVFDVLQRYCEDHGRYPDDLEALVDAGLLAAVPEVPEVRGTLDRWPLEYDVAPDGSFFQLSFAYDLRNGILPELVSCYRFSFEDEWSRRSYPPLWDVVCAERFGARYRESGDPAALGHAAEAILETGKRGRSQVCLNVAMRDVVRLLGEGEWERVSGRRSARVYEAPGGAARRFTFALCNADEHVGRSCNCLLDAVHARAGTGWQLVGRCEGR